MSMQDDMNPDDAGQTEDRDRSRRRSQQPQEPEEKPQSRKAVWLAMGAVALALGLIWVAPGIEPHVDETAPARLPTTRANPKTRGGWQTGEARFHAQGHARRRRAPASRSRARSSC